MFLHGSTTATKRGMPAPRDRIRAGFMTAGEGEFLGLGRAEAAARIARGRAIVEEATGRPIAGFVAPAWLYGQGALEALEECAIPIAEDHVRSGRRRAGASLAAAR